jgi:hypothetical protein
MINKWVARFTDWILPHVCIGSIFQDSIMQAVRDVHCYFHITFDRLTSGRNITADRSPEQIHPTDSIQYAHVLWHLPSSSSSQSQAGTELGSDFLLSTLRPEHKLSDDAAVVHGPSMSNKDSTVRNTPHFRTTDYFLLNVQTMHDVYSSDVSTGCRGAS